MANFRRHTGSIMDREVEQKAKAEARVEELWAIVDADGERTPSNISHIVNLIVPAFQSMHIMRNRVLSSRTLQVKFGAYTYKVWYENFRTPVKVERELIA